METSELLKLPSAGLGITLWLTGLSGAGKSTIARHLVDHIRDRGFAAELLDGHLVRKTLSRGLGFSREDRDVNVERIGFVADALSRNGVCAVVAAISPFREARRKVRASHEPGRFVEVWVRCPLHVLIERDVKGLYEKALAGRIDRFTGVSDVYEPPENPDVTVETETETPKESTERILRWMQSAGLPVGNGITEAQLRAQWMAGVEAWKSGPDGGGEPPPQN